MIEKERVDFYFKKIIIPKILPPKFYQKNMCWLPFQEKYNSKIFFSKILPEKYEPQESVG